MRLGKITAALRGSNEDDVERSDSSQAVYHDVVLQQASSFTSSPSTFTAVTPSGKTAVKGTAEQDVANKSSDLLLPPARSPSTSSSSSTPPFHHHSTSFTIDSKQDKSKHGKHGMYICLLMSIYFFVDISHSTRTLLTSVLSLQDCCPRCLPLQPRLQAALYSLSLPPAVARSAM